MKLNLNEWFSPGGTRYGFTQLLAASCQLSLAQSAPQVRKEILVQL